MNPTPSHTSAAIEVMPWAEEIRASAKRSAELRCKLDQLFEMMREPLASEAHAKARLHALQRLFASASPGPHPMNPVQKTEASSVCVRRPPSSRLI